MSLTLHPGYRSKMPRVLTFAQQPLRLLAEFGPEIGARERVGEVGGEEADLGAAVKALAVELEPVERLRLGEFDHGVGELDLAAGAAALLGENAKDLRLQDVAAGDDQIGGRLLARRLLHHLRDAEQLALGLADADDAIRMHALVRH